MRLVYLALDRPELQFTAKEVSRGLSSPTVRHWRLLKRAVRFTIRAPEIVWYWQRQRMPRTVVAWSDSDFAGCPLTRRSTSACALTFWVALPTH
eukprot:6491778-Amphidinium_carterae.1